MKATIEVTHNEMFTHGHYFLDLDFESQINDYGFKIYLNEENLSKLLYFLPQDNVLRGRCQRAGERCFGW